MHSVVLFFLMASSIMTVAVMVSGMPVAVVVSPVTVRIVTMTVAVTVVGRCDCHLEVVPCHVGEHTVLDVTSEVTLLREGIAILLRVHSPSMATSNNDHDYLMFLLKKRGRLSRTAMF